MNGYRLFKRNSTISFPNMEARTRLHFQNAWMFESEMRRNIVRKKGEKE